MAADETDAVEDDPPDDVDEFPPDDVDDAVEEDDESEDGEVDDAVSVLAAGFSVVGVFEPPRESVR